ncbi:hypothetical protein EV11_0929 [Prochlorococcus sp. SS52]|nr:hypothetical protein EV04_0229 [Prochlorococcus marinus str. LG]KGG22050.1 hypothetical protein EV08_0224 [Prochlorococcus marinus str. SS2]KGG24632.1 hypothetical protein EV09_0264 [Prochlorococcus marinus str. SS35]KGG33525.1 hypothetical protein EV10_0734 [Prochlorococcus marinus str. SS51]KGG36238.1 hypothetical protein EV11_0929 [Prochlorococcus sp. SS52]
MNYSTHFAPLLIGLTLGWFVMQGLRELFKEASMILVKK